MARLHATQLNPTGSYLITGSLDVYGQTTLQQTTVDQSALLVSGAIEIVKAEIQSQIVSASLTIENLGTLADRSKKASIDLGGFF